jgi:hypothetical protein
MSTTCPTDLRENFSWSSLLEELPLGLICTLLVLFFRHILGAMAVYSKLILVDRTFRFSVASTSVGFHIYNIGTFSDSNCKFFIKLWGNGGANWQTEEGIFYKE